ncbi:helix-turn-helix domain-containing protein [Sphingomonas chungangi]|nr:helix-turn-helix domain-containing protein [Sphingomonas chungangi]
MEVDLSTEQVAKKDRVAFWRDVVCQTFVELECGGIAATDFQGSVSTRNLGNVQFSSVRSSSHFVSRTRSMIAQSSKDYFLLSLQTDGVGLVEQDGRTAVLRPGDFALYDTTRPYDLRFHGHSDQLVLRLARSTVASRLADPESCTARRIAGDSAAGRLASTFIRQLHDSLDQLDPNSVSRLHGSMVDLMATALAEQAGAAIEGSEWQVLLRRKVLAYIDSNMADPRLTCESVAAAHGISERYMRKLFENSSMGVSEWIWTRRLDQAKRDLGDPMLTHIGITAVGYDAGFKDPAHFSRAFKARFGMTPSQHRAQTIASRAASAAGH